MSHTRNRRTAVFLTLLILVLIGVGFWATRTWLGQTLLPDNRAVAPVSETNKLNDEIGPTVDLREFLVNIISEDNSHYLKTAMTIELSSSAAQEELIARMPKVRDAVLLLISNKTFEELYDLQGKKQLKAEVMLSINSIISNGEVTAVYLTDFIVQ